MEKYEKKGQMQGGVVNAIITLIVGIGVSVMVLIFIGALGGQTYNLVETDITAITNDTIEASVRNSIVSGFSALEKTGDYLPLIVLAVVISLVLFLIIGMSAVTGGGGMGGRSAL